MCGGLFSQFGSRMVLSRTSIVLKVEWRHSVIAKVDFRNIEKVADRCGGRAVVTGTRIRIQYKPYRGSNWKPLHLACSCFSASR